MSINQDDFKKIWASTSSVPEYTFSDSDYQDGWEFVGNLPPTRAMWDTLQRRNDQKMKYLQDNGSMCFDSVADMVATDLEVGQTVITKGYYSVNDGGSSIYTIRAKDVSDVEDGGSIIFLDNNNVAELIAEDTISIKQFGAYGDGVHDDTDAFRSASLMQNLYVPKGNYLITDYVIGSNKVVDEGTYTNYRPIFPTANKLETFSRFGMKANFLLPEAQKMYGEAITFNTKTQKIILCCEGYGYSPEKNILFVLNKDTYVIEASYDYPHDYAWNVISYNEQDNVIYANGGNTCYRINGDDMTQYTTFTLPDNGNHAAHDNITKTDVLAISNYDTDKSFTIKVYSNGFANLLHTVTTIPNIIEDYAYQDICAYDGKVYLLTFANLYEIDVVTGEVNRIGISTMQEIEGCDFIDGEFFINTHQVGSNHVEYLYQYQRDAEPQFNKQLLPNHIQKTLDVSLNNFVAMGDYLVDSADTTDKNYPSGETKGYLHVTNSTGIGDAGGYGNMIAKQTFHSLTGSYSVYQRIFYIATQTWSSWTKVELVTAIGTNYIRYDSGLQIVFGERTVDMTGATATGTTGTNYNYRKQFGFGFPVPFTNVFSCSCNVFDSVNYWLASISYKNTTDVGFYVMGNNDTATKTVSIIAIGLWK